MDSFDSQLLPAVLAACQAGAAEASRAFSRAFSAPFEVAIGQGDHLDASALPESVSGPGLVLLLPVGNRAAAVVIGESTGLLPKWHRRPNATEIGKLAALAEQLGGLLLPGELPVKDCSGQSVADLAAALRRGECAPAAAVVHFTLTAVGTAPRAAALVWPLGRPAAVFDPVSPVAADADAKSSGLDTLPPYSRSLLKIKVPVMVTLARQKQSLGRIVEIVPGSIIQFDKSCDEMLELEVASRPIAKGECVKVGDKFGLRITSLVLPDERFTRVGGATR